MIETLLGQPVSQRPALVRRGRYLTTTFLLEVQPMISIFEDKVLIR